MGLTLQEFNKDSLYVLFGLTATRRYFFSEIPRLVNCMERYPRRPLMTPTATDRGSFQRTTPG